MVSRKIPRPLPDPHQTPTRPPSDTPRSLPDLYQSLPRPFPDIPRHRPDSSQTPTRPHPYFKGHCVLIINSPNLSTGEVYTYFKGRLVSMINSHNTSTGEVFTDTTAQGGSVSKNLPSLTDSCPGFQSLDQSLVTFSPRQPLNYE